MARLFKVARGVGFNFGRGLLRRPRQVLTFLSRIAALGLAVLLLCPELSPGAEAAAPGKKPKPAKHSVSGYGILGNRELKRILRTIELGGKKPAQFGPSFVEDAALIL